MTKKRPSLINGTILSVGAEALALPVAFLVNGLLSRELGPEGFGHFSLVAGLITWLEWSLVALFSRATVKLTAETHEWQPIGAVALRLHLLTGIGVMAAVWLLAEPVAIMMGETGLVPYIRLFAVDIPIFSLAIAHRNLLIGTGSYTGRAVATAARWIGRLLVVFVLIGLRFGIRGAVLGTITASSVQLAASRLYIRPSWRHSTFPARQLLEFGAPLLLFGLSRRLFDNMGLFLLKALGGNAAQAGFYGAAYALASIPGVFAMALSPILIGELSRLRSMGSRSAEMIHNTFRGICWLLPPAAIGAVSAPEILSLIYGPAFVPASPVFILLLVAGMAGMILSMVAAILTATGKPEKAFIFAGPLVPVGALGCIVLVPLMGGTGAALSIACTAATGAIVGTIYVCRLARFPAKTFARCVFVGVLGSALAARYPASGLSTVLKLFLLTALSALGLIALGEFGKLSTLRDRVRRGTFL